MPIDPKDFTYTWEPVLPSRMQWVNVTHPPTGKTFRVKCAWCVSDRWLGLAPEEAEAARDTWVRDTARQTLELLLNPPPSARTQAEIIADLEAAMAALEAELDAADGEL